MLCHKQFKFTKVNWSKNPSNDQPQHQSVNQSIDRSNNQRINHSIDRSISPSVGSLFNHITYFLQFVADDLETIRHQFVLRGNAHLHLQALILFLRVLEEHVHSVFGVLHLVSVQLELENALESGALREDNQLVAVHFVAAVEFAELVDGFVVLADEMARQVQRFDERVPILLENVIEQWHDRELSVVFR